MEEAVNTTEPPFQNVVGPDGVMVTTGVGLTVTTVPEAAEAVQPFTSVIVTLYVPETETVMEEVVAPVLQI